MSEMKKTYEVMVIIKPDLNQKQTDTVLAAIRTHVKDAKGTIEHEDIWGKRDLAYDISKYSEGYYAVLYISLAPDHLDGLKKELDLEQGIMRKMILTFPKNLSIASYISMTKVVTEKLEEEEAVKRKEREEAEKKQKARRGGGSAPAEAAKEVIADVEPEDKKRIETEIEDIIGEL